MRQRVLCAALLPGLDFFLNKGMMKSWLLAVLYSGAIETLISFVVLRCGNTPSGKVVAKGKPAWDDHDLIGFLLQLQN